ncbi:quinone oxidoreductase [Pseudomassariella vexata]|uniref:Quinone oxidoreductase n=1 Tax=Pseudomassariella vexata TaxID=1141098 RepID=A0A1Y2DQD7_9PEZI|nr:quinone oxidoreductase [Pseudomassariella vexata]ORY61512.1 quinone oxidoreductase [Pseudomassariella vexata]
MHIAQVQSWPEGPRYVSVADPPAPTAGQTQLRVLAAGLHQVVRSRASGNHYSAKTLPHILGVDAVAKDEATGQLYYVMDFGDGNGTFRDYINVDKENNVVIPLPEGVDPINFAASVNPAMSSWMAITQRTDKLPKDFTVLILGATSASGRLAVYAAKALGAGKVVGAARSAETLKGVEGLDDSITFKDPITDTDFSQADADVILDYVFGDVAQHVLSTIKTKKPVQYVQIGTLSQEAEIDLSGPLLRSTNLTIRGAGPGSWRLSALVVELKTLVPVMAKWPQLGATVVPLRDIETAWSDRSIKGRIVYVP